METIVPDKGPLNEYYVASFWQGAQSNVFDALKKLEEMEAWCYQKSEIPVVYDAIDEAIPKLIVACQRKSGGPEIEECIDHLIPLLTSIPICSFTPVIFYIHNEAFNSANFIECLVNRCLDHITSGSVVSQEAQKVLERINTIVTVDIRLRMFGDSGFYKSGGRRE